MQGFGEVLEKKLSSGAWADSLPVAIYSCDRDGCIRQYNRRAAELWRQTPEIGDRDHRFCGAYRLRRLDGSELPHAQTPMAEVLRTGVPVRGETVEILRPDGSSCIVQVSIDPLLDEQGEVIGAVNCFHDVTELHRSRQEAAEGKRRLETLLEALPAAIYMTDEQGVITFYNRSAVHLAGRTPAQGDRWCVSWRLRRPDGSELAHDECPMAIALTERRPLCGEEAVAERPDGTRIPFLAYPTPIFHDDGSLAGAINMLVDISAHKRAADDQRLLINELNHRVKNTLATVQSMARQTLRRTGSPDAFVDSLLGRIDALAAAHNTLTQHAWRGAELHELAARQLAVDATHGERIVLAGPTVALPAQTALHLALLLHELGTNARKYGALSVAEGRVELDWSLGGDGTPLLELTWREHGGPQVSEPTTRGFGSLLIQRSLQAEGGTTAVDYRPEGLVCSIRVPLPAHAPVLEPDGEAEPALILRPNGGSGTGGWRGDAGTRHGPSQPGVPN